MHNYLSINSNIIENILLILFNRLPFKQNLLEYFVEFIIEFINFYYVMLTTAGVFALLCGSCLMIMAFVKDLRTNIYSLNALSLDTENPTEIQQKIMEFIQFHSLAKRLSHLKISFHQI